MTHEDNSSLFLWKGSRQKSFNAVVRLPSAAHKPVLNNKKSAQFKTLSKNLCNKVTYQ